VIRRNTFSDIMGTSLSLGGARGTIAEENVILRSHLNPYKVVAWTGPAIICNGPMGLVIRNNILADCHDSAVWEDCWGLGLLLYGNTMYNLGADGFYIEAGVKGTVLPWNTVFDCGGGLYVTIEFRNETGQNVTRQYLVGAGAGQKAVGTEWMTGNFKYKPSTGKATAPKGARWFKPGFGLRNCTGWVARSDIDIQTRPGAPEAEVTRAFQ
jgi:hypothetical protein